MTRNTHFLFAAAMVAASSQAHAGANLMEGVRVTQGAENAMVRHTKFTPWKPVVKGRVPAGMEVQCEKPCTVQVDPDNSVVLSPGAVITVATYFYVPLTENAPSLTPAHLVELREGMIEAISPTERSLALVVATGPEEHVALRDARAQIAYSGERTAASAMRGNVRVGGSHSWVTLEKGQRASVRSKGKPTSPKPVLEAPAWSASDGSCPSPISVTEPSVRVAVGGCWQAPAAAKNYRVELAEDAEFKRPIASDVVGAPSWSSMLGVGRYFARVRAIDSDGIFGIESKARPLAVVSCAMPPGATANFDQHAFVIPQGKEIALGAIDGVDLALDNGGFSMAPAKFRMDEAPEHMLRFRLHDDPSSVSSAFTARRRPLVANVEISPRKAAWPTDPVEIAVTIEDPSGMIDAAKFEPHLQVLLGLTELAVQWSHRGAIWSAHVQPRSMGGPTVLRVIAQDEFGTQIGRNFLEIDHKTPRLAIEAGDGRRVAHN